MAFISAVLMLFLSVVLMLPISTLTSKNYSTDSKRVVNSSISTLLIINNEICDYIIFGLLSVLVVLILSAIYHTARVGFKNIADLDMKNIYHFLQDDDFYSMLRGKGDYETLLKKSDELLYSSVTYHISTSTLNAFETFYHSYVLRNNFAVHLLF
jgi:hypothetical protein